jgi:RNA polymerase sigma-70 factor, ECF subfamily
MSFLAEVRLDESFAPFLAYQDAFGFIPNLLRAQTLLPRVIQAQSSLECAVRLHAPAISRLHKERILLSIAAARQDAYCLAIDGKILSSLGQSPAQISDLLSDYRSAGLSPAELASLRFCLKLARYAPSVGSDDIAELRACGFDDQAILEAVVLTALAVYRCTLSVGLGPDADFAPMKLARTAHDSPPTQGSPRTSPQAHGPAQKSGPYVSAPFLSPAAFGPFAIVLKTHGFIPNFFRAQTLRPDILAAELEAVRDVLLPEDVLTRVQKECILLAISAVNLNSYCVAVHSNMLRGLGMPSEEGDQIAVDHHYSSLSEPDKGLLDFAIKLASRPSEFSRDDVSKLRSLGFTDTLILECEVVTALNNFSNTLQMGLGIEPDFDPPPVFQENKMHLSAAVGPPMAMEAVTEQFPVSRRIVPPDPDAELVALAQIGKLDAFEDLARRHSQLIYRTLVAMMGNAADAQDAMQDTLLSAFKHIGTFQGRSKFSTWLVSIAKNYALQRFRRSKKFESLDDDELGEERDFHPRQIKAWQDDPEQGYSKLEIRNLVELGILALPNNYRVVVMLRDIQHIPTDDVARQLGLSSSAVKTRLLRGRLMLREWLTPHMTKGTRGMAQ